MGTFTRFPQRGKRPGFPGVQIDPTQLRILSSRFKPEAVAVGDPQCEGTYATICYDVLRLSHEDSHHHAAGASQ